MPHALALRVPMENEWEKLTPRDWPELLKSPKPIVAQWVSGQNELTLYEDGTFESVGPMPVELLLHVSAEWHNSLKGRIA
jgi:hypothetical protein